MIDDFDGVDIVSTTALIPAKRALLHTRYIATIDETQTGISDNDLYTIVTAINREVKNEHKKNGVPLTPPSYFKRFYGKTRSQDGPQNQ